MTTARLLADRRFRTTLLANCLWINLSEVARYFGVVRPMLQGAFPDDPGVAAITPTIFAIWVVWDMVLVLAATGYVWLHLSFAGTTFGQAAAAATWFTLAVFGLLWLGVVNMGLAPAQMLAVLPLAWAELMGAALIVRWAMRRPVAGHAAA